MELRYFIPWNFINVSSMFVGHSRSGIITMFIFRASRHSLLSPFFFSVHTIGDDHGDIGFSMISNFNMRCISASTLGIRAIGIGYCRSELGRLV